MVHTLPPPFFFRAFRVFRGSTLVFRGSIRGSYSPTFILFSCLSCFSWLPLPLTFVSIRVHSWFILSPPSFYFRAFRVFRGSTPVFRDSIRGSIRVHSCPFVVHTLPPSFYFRVFRVFRGSTPVFRGSIRVHSWFKLSPLLSFFVFFVFFVVPLLYFVVPFVVQSSGVGVFLRYRRGASPLRCQVILTECGRRRAAAPIISGRKVQTPQGRKPG